MGAAPSPDVLATARLVRPLLALEAAAFASAALVHSGVLVRTHEHWKAATAESIIAAVLLAGAVASVAAPRASRAAGLAAQGFALLGTAVGIFTIAIGVGPRSTFDYVLHAGFVAALVTGLVLVARGSLASRGGGAAEGPPRPRSPGGIPP